ncbi:alpha/beta hydrolase [Mesorhizobium sp. BAC0120]|uniref:alpha/beta hydrolase n=1 Tax=Mesorhizobium sp. BAC0120 TaxID=3090670 RepID=UPI00298C8755|nr:alpha/beta hydrolase [Mesorhizobium sp. BAC0120]MDW6026174.1 alpha/beta hydrolase [Mesorhizobium sp. BAC0120]
MTERGKYETRLDPEYWAYVDRVNGWYPPEVLGQPIERQREIYNAMCREFHAGYPAGVTATDSLIADGDRPIAVRRYTLAGRQAKALILYFHGGGYVLGGLDSHDDICAELCAGTGYAVMSVDYRLSPEHRHPAAFNDALTAFRAVATTCSVPVVLCGESAGGNLAAAVAHATRGDLCAPAGQVLVYPSLGGDQSNGSYVEHAQAPLLSVRDLAFYDQARTGIAGVAADPTLAPLSDAVLSDLPPTVIVTAECDPLSSDGETYRDLINAAGGRAAWIEEQRLTHSFLRARKTVARAAEAFVHIVQAVDALGKSDWPY